MYKVLAFIFLLFSQVSSFSQSNFVYRNVPSKYLYLPSMIEQNFLTDLKLVQKNCFDLTKLLPANYVTDGSIDYTSYIQEGLYKHSNCKFPNFPILLNEKGLRLISNSTLYFPENSLLILKGNKQDFYDILQIKNVQNLTLYFPKIKGDKNWHLAKTGQWGMGIGVRASANIRIIQPTITNCWGDGIYIGQLKSVGCSDILIYQAYLDNNRRNALSIIKGTHIQIKEGIFSNSNGQNPQSGIDIEPNFNTDSINHVSISNVLTYNNVNYGLVISLQNLEGENQNEVNIDVDSHQDFYSKNALAIIGRKSKFNNLKGDININHANYINNTLSGVKLPLMSYGNKIHLKSVASFNLDSNQHVVKKPNELELLQIHVSKNKNFITYED